MAKYIVRRKELLDFQVSTPKTPVKVLECTKPDKRCVYCMVYRIMSTWAAITSHLKVNSKLM